MVFWLFSGQRYITFLVLKLKKSFKYYVWQLGREGEGNQKSRKIWMAREDSTVKFKIWKYGKT